MSPCRRREPPGDVREAAKVCLEAATAALARGEESSGSCSEASFDLTRAITEHLSRLIPQVECRTVLDLVLEVLSETLKSFEAAPLGWTKRRVAEMLAWREGQEWRSSLPEMDEADYQWPGANTLAVAVEDAWLAIHQYRNPARFCELTVSCLIRSVEGTIDQYWGLLNILEWNAAFDGKDFLDQSILFKLSKSCEAGQLRAQEYLSLLERVERLWLPKMG